MLKRAPQMAAARIALGVHLALLLLSSSGVHGEWALTTSSAWFVDASAGGFAPNGTDWFDPVASPVKLALRDLKRDWYKVVGVPPTVIDTLPAGAWDGDVVVVFAIAAPGDDAPSESFNVTASLVGAVPTLRVTGADMRGLIYGIFHVSADFLGVDPYWWFNDVTPVYEPAGIVVVSSYSYESGAPAFDSRGAFNNDEDLSGYFASSPLGDAVYVHTSLHVSTLLNSTQQLLSITHSQPRGHAWAAIWRVLGHPWPSFVRHMAMHPLSALALSDLG
jgi:hypothetical protein